MFIPTPRHSNIAQVFHYCPITHLLPADSEATERKEDDRKASCDGRPGEEIGPIFHSPCLSSFPEPTCYSSKTFTERFGLVPACQASCNTRIVTIRSATLGRRCVRDHRRARKGRQVSE